MDIQEGLVCVALALLSAIVIFVISMLSMKEKTYEEAIAEQRKLPEENLLLGRSAKDKAKDKKQKKAGKKVKEKNDREKSEQPETVTSRTPAPQEKVRVDFEEPEAEVISERPPQEDKKKKKKDKVKPILLNKDEQSLIVEVPITPSNHFEEILPKDDLLLKRKESKEEMSGKGGKDKEPPVVVQEVAKPTQQSNKSTASSKTAPKNDKPSVTSPKVDKSAANAPKAEKPVPVSPKVDKPAVVAPKVEKPTQSPSVPWEQPIAAVSQQETQPAKERNRKKRSELATLQQMSGDREGVNVSLLMPLVRKAELSRSEIQILIDLLLNKQQGSAVTNSEWFEGRQDPVVKLKKQLAEKEKALLEEQEASQAVQSKLKELRTELNAERSRLTHSTRQLEESLTAKTSEAQGLASRLQHLQDTHNVDKQALVQQVQQLQAKLSEEHVRLRQAQEEQAQALQQELLSQRQTLELHIARLSEQRQEAEAVVGQLRGQLQEQEGVASTLQGQRDSHAELVRQLETQALHLKEASDIGQQDLARQIEELNLVRNELELRVSGVQQREAAFQYEIDELRDSLASYADVNEKLTAQLTAAQDVTHEVQRLRDDNDRLAAQVSHLSELQQEAQQLREENESLAAQVTAVTERPAAEGRENGDAHFPEEPPRQDGYGKEDLVLHDSIVKQKDSLVEELKEEVRQKASLLEKQGEEVKHQVSMLGKLEEELKQKESLLETLTSEVNTQKTELHRLSEELEEQRRRNNDAFEKVRQEEQAATKQLLQRIFPDIRLEENKSEFVEGFLTELKSHLQHVPAVEDQSEEIAELETQNSQLLAMNAHYKTIINDTEGMLNKLQTHIEQEESRWSQQLQVKDSEMEAMKQKLGAVPAISPEMQTKLQVLEKDKRELDLKYAAAVSKYEQIEDEKTQLNSELESLKQEKSRELAKLRSLVQIGQDSLSQEQQLTSELQQQVDKLNGMTENHNIETNGPASESSLTEGGSVKK